MDHMYQYTGITFPSWNEAANFTRSVAESAISYGQWAIDCAGNAVSHLDLGHKASTAYTALSSQATVLGTRSVEYVTGLQSYAASVVGTPPLRIQGLLSGAAAITPIVMPYLYYRNVRRSCKHAVEEARQERKQLREKAYDSRIPLYMRKCRAESTCSRMNRHLRECQELRQSSLFSLSNIASFVTLNVMPVLLVPQFGPFATAGVITASFLTHILGHDYSKDCSKEAVQELEAFLQDTTNIQKRINEFDQLQIQATVAKEELKMNKRAEIEQSPQFIQLQNGLERSQKECETLKVQNKELEALKKQLAQQKEASKQLQAECDNAELLRDRAWNSSTLYSQEVEKLKAQNLELTKRLEKGTNRVDIAAVNCHRSKLPQPPTGLTKIPGKKYP